MATLPQQLRPEDEVPPDVAPLDEKLRCDLCGEHYRVAVSIGDPRCGHTFCAECILLRFKRQMEGTTRKRTCPHCRFEVKSPESALVTNRTVQEAVIAFRDSLSKRRLLDSMKKKQSPIATPSPAARPVRGTRRHQNSYNEENNDADESSITIEPDVPERSPRESAQPLRYRPPVAYNKKNPKQLREMCAEDGLKTTGAKETLMERHQNYVLLWNAERYSINPRTPRELADLLKARERTYDQEKMFNTNERKDSAALKNYLESGGKTSGDEDEFKKRLSCGFDKLVAMQKAKMLAMKAKQKGPGAATDQKMDKSSDSTDTLRTVSSQPALHERCASNAEPSTPDVLRPRAPTNFGSDYKDQVESPKEGTLSPKILQCDEQLNALVVSQHTTDEQHFDIIDLLGEDDGITKTQNESFPEPSAKLNYDRDTSVSSSSVREKRVLESDNTSVFNNKRERRSILSPWTCGRCTFYNERRLYKTAKCEICGTKRPEV